MTRSLPLRNTPPSQTPSTIPNMKQSATPIPRDANDLSGRSPRPSDATAHLPYKASENTTAATHGATSAVPQRTLDPKDPSTYTLPFIHFLRDNPTVFHAVQATQHRLVDHGFTRLSERDYPWPLQAGGSYVLTRNGSSLIAFTIGKDYKPGNGVGMIAGHVDALTAKVKPFPKISGNDTGFERLGVAPYAGGLNNTWWDRDLGIAGRVMVKEGGKVRQRLVDLKEPIARIPTLAPHFGAVASGPFNVETQMVPVVGLEGAGGGEERLGGEGSFSASQPPRLVRAVSRSVGVEDYDSIINWELELYDTQPAQLGGFDRELLYGGRLDDKLCSWAAVEGLLASTKGASSSSTGSISLVGLFDDEEIGSLLRQGAHGNFLPLTIERMVQSFSSSEASARLGQTYANSYLVSADVTHSVNPNFLNAYLPNHAPQLNKGVAVSADSNGHMTTDAVSTSFMQRIAAKGNCKLQTFQIRNDVRSGGTIGPMLSSAMGCRSIDVGIPQLSMHSIRAATGSQDPGLGVCLFKTFFDCFEEVDNEFRED